MTQPLHAHFFGCSLTAGDELSDEKYLPWKFVEEHTTESYYEKRKRLGSNYDWVKYQEENKLQSYPALISQTDPNIKTYNHAHNGKSHRRNILDILRLVEESTQKIDVIYFQLSPSDREIIIGDDCIYDIIDAHGDDITQEYIIAKLKLARLEHQSIQDSMDIHLLTGYLKTKNIPFYFLNFGGELDRRIADIKTAILHNEFDGTINFDFLRFEEFTNLINLSYLNFKYDRLIGGHMPKEQHHEIAKFITQHIKEITNKY